MQACVWSVTQATPILKRRQIQCNFCKGSGVNNTVIIQLMLLLCICRAGLMVLARITEQMVLPGAAICLLPASSVGLWSRVHCGSGLGGRYRGGLPTRLVCMFALRAAEHLEFWRL
jgi:hypothetical protein